MSTWINGRALLQILGIGLLCGAGLPALFAVGLRALSLPARHGDPAPATVDGDRVVGGSVLGMTAAGLCFLIVLAAIAWAVYLIVTGA